MAKKSFLSIFTLSQQYPPNTHIELHLLASSSFLKGFSTNVLNQQNAYGVNQKLGFHH